MKQENRLVGLPLERRAQAVSCWAVKAEDMKSRLTAAFAEEQWFTKLKIKSYLEEEVLRQCRDFINFPILQLHVVKEKSFISLFFLLCLALLLAV